MFFQVAQVLLPPEDSGGGERSPLHAPPITATASSKLGHGRVFAAGRHLGELLEEGARLKSAGVVRGWAFGKHPHATILPSIHLFMKASISIHADTKHAKHAKHAKFWESEIRHRPASHVGGQEIP